MYVIAGASGNTGGRIANALLDAGKQVTVISRSQDHIAGLIAKGATPAIGDLTDAAFLKDTFKGAKAVYALIPPNMGAEDFRAYQNQVSDAFVSGLKDSGVTHVVTLSSFGAHIPEGTGVIAGLYDFETKLKNELPDLNVLNLRAGFFMENFYGMIGTIKQNGILGGFPIKGDIKMPVVHTADIADVAARRLESLDFSGQDRLYIGGPADISLNEAAKVLGDSIGNPDLNYVQFPYEDSYNAMVGMGLTPSLSRAYVDFCKSVSEDYESFMSDYVRDEKTTTPTTLEDFAATQFAPAYKS